MQLTWRLESIGEGERARVQRARVVGPVIQTGRCCVVIMGRPALRQHKTAPKTKVDEAVVPVISQAPSFDENRPWMSPSSVSVRFAFPTCAAEPSSSSSSSSTAGGQPA